MSRGGSAIRLNFGLRNSDCGIQARSSKSALEDNPEIRRHTNPEFRIQKSAFTKILPTFDVTPGDHAPVWISQSPR
jgi:hypothetical protein